MILKRPWFLFKSTGLTGLNCFNTDYEAGHSNRVLTRGQSAWPKFKKNKFSEVLWRNQKPSKIRNEIQSLFLISLTKKIFDKNVRPHRPLVKSLLKQPVSCLACTWIMPARPVNIVMIFVITDALRKHRCSLNCCLLEVFFCKLVEIYFCWEWFIPYLSSLLWLKEPNF